MNPHFYRATSARFLFSLSVQSQAVLMGWQMYEFTKDPLKLGLIGLTEAVPALALALFSGYLVDRLNPLRIYQAIVWVSLVSVLISWSATGPAALYLAALLTGLVRSFSSPSMGALIPRLISRAELKKSAAFTALAFQFAGVVGPGLAGILLGIRGYSYPYAFCVAALLVASLTLLTVEYQHKPAPRTDGPRKRILGEMLLGMKFVFNHPVMLSSMSLDMFAVLFGGVTALLPVYSAEILHAGPTGLGWLRAAPAIGAMIAGVILLRRPIAKGAGRKLLAAVFGFGLCILVFAVSRDYLLSWIMLAFSGALDSVSMVIRGSILQLASPDGMRGRISSVSAIFIGSSNEIGAFESGLAARLLGTVPSVLFGGGMTLLTVLVVGIRGKKLRELDLSTLEGRQV
ncbi:MAG: MFS transporter [Bdellovibrionales bacterium]|nr:MFS transporter [Bdellovibrionales bacterium]